MTDAERTAVLDLVAEGNALLGARDGVVDPGATRTDYKALAAHGVRMLTWLAEVAESGIPERAAEARGMLIAAVEKLDGFSDSKIRWASVVGSVIQAGGRVAAGLDIETAISWCIDGTPHLRLPTQLPVRDRLKPVILAQAKSSKHRFERLAWHEPTEPLPRDLAAPLGLGTKAADLLHALLNDAGLLPEDGGPRDGTSLRVFWNSISRGGVPLPYREPPKP